MKSRIAPFIVAAAIAGLSARAQTYVTPMFGGGQVAANMAHIDISYDADANSLSAVVDDSEGTPELRALFPEERFDPGEPWAVLTGKSYNAQYGWNPSGFWACPPGAAIWIEPVFASAGLEFYEEFGVFGAGSYAPIYGTGGTSRSWRWSGRMVHNICAVRDPDTNSYCADFHIYFGDAVTGSRLGYAELDDALVHLKWTAAPVTNMITFTFGAESQTNGAPLLFLNADHFVADTETVINLTAVNEATNQPRYECTVLMNAVASTPMHGGPVPNHAKAGACLELEVDSLTGPQGGQLSFGEPGACSPSWAIDSGVTGCTKRVRLSESTGTPGCDPFGRHGGRHISVSKPGLYCLGFRVVDVSTNGTMGRPVHAPSVGYRVYLQAGLTISAVHSQGSATEVAFAGEPGKTYYLERTSSLEFGADWQTVAGPALGTNRLLRLVDAVPENPAHFYRVRCE